MDEQLFSPGKRFPADMPVPQGKDVADALLSFGVVCPSPVRLIDSTHDASDIRLNYIVGKQYVLRFCNAPDMTEKRMNSLSRLIGRYHSAGILCPRFIPDKQGLYLHSLMGLKCYLSEYVDLPLAEGSPLPDEEELIGEVEESVARFARINRDTDLSDTMGMYSLFDLSPFDIPIGEDEKQQNFDQLLALLREEKEDALANLLAERHAQVRSGLKAVFRSLPRCVFQGDENFSNVLIDSSGHFAGFIDFNLAGTEVIVNQLANLAGFDYDEKCLSPKGAEARLDFAVARFRRHMARMLTIYPASDIERRALAGYAWIVMTAQWPTLCFFKSALSGPLREEILSLLTLIASLPEERLTV